MLVSMYLEGGGKLDVVDVAVVVEVGRKRDLAHLLAIDLDVLQGCDGQNVVW